MSKKRRQIRKNRPKTPANVRAEKRRQVWHVIGQSLLIAVGIPVMMLGFIFAHDLLTQGEYFRLRHMRIDGADRLTRDAIRIQAGIPEPANVLALNLTRIRKRLVRHPWIADASVARSLPDRLHIQIREERTQATLQIADAYYLVNAGGSIFAEADRAAPETAVITGLGFADLAPGGRIPDGVWQRLSRIIGAAAGAEPSAPLYGVRRLHVDPDAGITVYAARIPGVVKLAGTPIPHEMELMDRVATFLKRSNRITAAASIDFRNPKRIVATPMPIPKPVRHLKEEQHAAKT